MALIIDPVNDTTFYDSVRRLLGGVDEDILPNEDISDPAILDVAEMQVIDLVPDYDILSPSDKAKVRLATIHIMASLLCPSMPSRIDVEVKTIDVTWKRKPVDYEELAQTLLARAYDLLNNLASLGGDSIVFAIAPSKRAVKAREKC
jgi:hypothetical protein